MQDYGSNAFADKKPAELPEASDKKPDIPEGKERRTEKVTEGKTTVRTTTHLRDLFVPEDIHAVREHIVRDVVGPAIKKVLFDVLVSGVEAFLYPNGKPGGSSGTKISYNGFFSGQQPTSRAPAQPYRSSVIDCESVIFQSRTDAEAVLDALYETLRDYHAVRVADFYEAAGVTFDNYMANSYGWTDLSGAKILMTYDGYVIRMPKPCAIRR